MSDIKLSMRSSGVAIIAVIAVLSLVTSFYYGGQGSGAVTACQAADSRLSALRPLARGDMAAFVVPKQSQLLPNLSLRDGTDAQRQLSDWQGRTVLMNIWATWCAPCRHEMPALDRLQATLGSDDFEVLAINIDTGDPARPRAFLDKINVDALEFYADSTTSVFKQLKSVGRAPGMPTTLLIDANGCELGFLAGAAEWDSPDAMALIRAAMAPLQ